MAGNEGTELNTGNEHLRAKQKGLAVIMPLRDASVSPRRNSVAMNVEFGFGEVVGSKKRIVCRSR
jgi:hypothetical protein